jgi:hypothetical protein
MNDPICVVHERIELINYNFLDISAFKGPFNSIVKKVVFLQILEPDLPPAHYDLKTSFMFHRNMIEAINLLSSVEEIVIENYPFLSDDHFKFLLIFCWEKLTYISLTRCRSITNRVFRWISNNCKKLEHFELTCHYLMGPLFNKEKENLEHYFQLDCDDLKRFFSNNCRSLETCEIQLTKIGQLRSDLGEYDDLIMSLCKCSNLKKVCLFVEESYAYEVSHVLSILISEKMIWCKFLVGKFTVINFCGSGPSNNNEGFFRFLNSPLLIRSVSDESVDLVNTNLVKFFESHGENVTHVTLSDVVNLSNVVLTTLGTFNHVNLSSLKILNCGINFVKNDIDFVMENSLKLKFVAVVGGSSKSFGVTDIHLFENRVVFANKSDGLKWKTSDVKRHKKKLDIEDYVWLADDTEGDLSDSENEL